MGQPVKTIYTDGACVDNPGGAGGWAYIVEGGAMESGHDASTTNNRMEMLAAVKALAHVARNESALVYSDSKYLVLGVTRWLPAWKQRGWRLKTHHGAEPKNLDLWRQIDAALDGREVRFLWIRGHSGNRYNEQCDLMANDAAMGRVIALTQAPTQECEARRMANLIIAYVDAKLAYELAVREPGPDGYLPTCREERDAAELAAEALRKGWLS